MLKSIHLSVFLSILFVSTINAQSNVITYSDIERVSDNADQKELFDRAVNWFEDQALLGNMELLVKGKDQLIGNMSFDYDAKTISGGKMVKGKIKCTVIVSVKDGRYKYGMKDFEHIPDGIIRKKYSFGMITKQSTCPDNIKLPLTNEDWKDKVWRDLKLKSKRNAQSLAKALEIAMNPKQGEEDLIGDNW